MNALSIAFDSIWHHRTRSGLTALGVVIGVFAVVTLTTLGAAVSQYVSSQFKVFGATVITVMPALPGVSSRFTPGGPKLGHHRGMMGGEGGPGAGGGPLSQVPSTLTLADVNAIAHAKTRTISAAAPVVNLPAIVSVNGATAPGTPVIGTTGVYFSIERLPFDHGQFRSSGVVLGHVAAATLFPHLADPTGRIVHVNGVALPVSGVLKASGNHFGGDPDASVYLPATRGLSLTALHNISSIVVAARTDAQVGAASTAVTAVLDHRHPVKDFALITASEILSTIQSTLSVITSFLAGLAAVSLVVGGVGIMNIMLVTVTERFREIGIRKALGARDSDILLQFLTESALLAVLGGAVGILLSALASRVIGRLMGVPVGIDMASIALALGFSLVVGALFGVLPALSAARLAPAQALRTE